VYFSKKADSVLGKERVERLRAFKNEIDPINIMNPGKVIGSGLIGIALDLAGMFELELVSIRNSSSYRTR